VSKPLFVDHDEREYERQQDADERRRHFRVVRDHMAGGVEAAENEAVLLAQDFADVSDAANLLYAHFGHKPHLLAFVYAVIGATGGSAEFVEITDDVLAERLGRSTKTVQSYRNEFREWKDHGTVIEIRDNYRTPEGESHPHRYRCHVTGLAVETVLDARLSPEWNRDRHKAMKEAARTIGDAAPGFPPRKAKKRRKASDAEVMRRDLQQAAERIGHAANLRPMVRNPDYAELYALRQQLAEKLQAFDEAFGLESDFHVNTEEEHMENEAPSPSSEPSAEPSRMEAKSDSEGVETTPRWKNSSTWNDSTESTTYGDRDFSPPEFPPGADADEGALYMREVRKFLAEKQASGKTEAEAYEEAQNEIGEFEDWQARRVAVFDSICDRLKGDARDATAAT
jgi:hypothetical protein